MTLREYYAGLALQGLCGTWPLKEWTNTDLETATETAVALADQLIKQLEAPPKSFLLTEKVPEPGQAILYECNHGFKKGYFIQILLPEHGIGQTWIHGTSDIDTFERWKPIPKEAIADDRFHSQIKKP